MPVDSPLARGRQSRPMKSGPFIVLLGACALLAVCASCKCSRTGQGPKADLLAERSVQLPNGLQADLVSGNCGDSATLVVLLKAGIDHDPPGRSGMAQVAAHVLASSAPSGHAERLVETGNEAMVYSVVVPATRLLEEIDEVAAWMSQRAPTDFDLGRARAVVLQEIGKLQGADAALTARSLAQEAVLPTRGNGKRNGIAAEVEAITLAELQAFFKEHVKPGNAHIGVVGRFDPEPVRARIEAAFAPIAAGTPPAARNPPESSVKGTLVMGETPKAVAIAVPAPATSDPLYAPFLVLAARLLDKPAQPRTWEADYDPVQRPELLFISGPVGEAEQPEPAAGRMRTEAAALLAQPPGPEEAAKVKQRFRLLLEPRSLDPAFCSKDPRAFGAARLRGAQRKLETSPLAHRIEATTKDQLEAAAKLFDTKRTAAVIAGGAIR